MVWEGLFLREESGGVLCAKGGACYKGGACDVYGRACAKEQSGVGGASAGFEQPCLMFLHSKSCFSPGDQLAISSL